ncbi:MAG TPA: hypothetical protein VMU59_11510 [Caulobacteraceae bacterium]|nr:hypothetical protein [Caulobacteraceae bacterium]
MGYRDDFYIVDNIIGYSGSLSDFPSVYFQTKGEFGHITQKHPSSQNVGRSIVQHAAGYKIENVMVKGQLKLLESMNGAVFHESRSTLKRVAELSAADKAIVAQSIWQCKLQKQIDFWSEDDFDLIDDVMAKHKQVMAQLKLLA